MSCQVLLTWCCWQGVGICWGLPAEEIVWHGESGYSRQGPQQRDAILTKRDRYCMLLSCMITMAYLSRHTFVITLSFSQIRDRQSKRLCFTVITPLKWCEQGGWLLGRCTLCPKIVHLCYSTIPQFSFNYALISTHDASSIANCRQKLNQ